MVKLIDGGARIKAAMAGMVLFALAASAA